MGFLVKILVTALAAYFAAWLLPGVAIANVQTTIIVALVLAILNAIVKPLLVLLTIPITIITLGLFLLVINIIIVKLADYLIDGFTVKGWLAALLFSLIVSVVSSILHAIAGDKD
ncbi:MAG TPA: phage holin family protein [Flavisolibacter sp.]|jgi:putative membrane protein|nr:phage holin family protein [Flavisolibacter sp.]